MIGRTLVRPLRTALLVGALVAVMPTTAHADTSGTATITGGTLTLVSPTTVAFAAALNGTDQDITAPQALDVWDDTGSGAGWNISATATTFTAGSHTLSPSAVTVLSTPTVVLDAGAGTGTLAVTDVSYPYTLPAAATAPTATKLFNATASSGMGHETATATMHLAIPRTTFAGVYTSDWRYSLVSAP
jgi:hypothetical protein